jgi:hypothetical protein
VSRLSSGLLPGPAAFRATADDCFGTVCRPSSWASRSVGPPDAGAAVAAEPPRLATKTAATVAAAAAAERERVICFPSHVLRPCSGAIRP